MPGFFRWTSLLRTAISLIAVITLFISSSPAVYADNPPGLPHQFYGTVRINGSLASSGYIVTAKINNTQVASSATDTQGRYGYTTTSLFLVSGSSGNTINFYVNGVQATQTATFSAGSNTALNLTVTGTVPVTTTLTISTTILPNGTDSTAYDTTTLSATGGSGTKTWSINAGNLPVGLSLSAAGVISGTPTVAGIYDFTLKVTDTSSNSDTQSYSVTIAEASEPEDTTPPETTTPTTTTVTTYLGGGSAGSFSVSSSGVVASGAIVSSSNGNISINITPNTTINLQGSNQLSINELANYPAPPSGSRTITAYSCGPDNSVFSPSITLTLKYDPADLPEDVAESDLYIALQQNGNWTELNSTVNTTAHTVSAGVSHFSTYAVLGRVTETDSGNAVFVTSGLTASPTAVQPGQAVTISVNISNTGDGAGSKMITLKVNNKSAGQRSVTLEPGKSETVTFTITPAAEGIYSAVVEGESAVFEVEAAPAVTPPEQENSLQNMLSNLLADSSLMLTLIIVAGGLLIILLLLILILRRKSSY